MKKQIAGLLFGMLVGGPCFAEIAVIVHPSNAAQISEDDVMRLFLGKKNKFSDGSKAVPIYLAQGHDAREEFNQKALRKSSSQLKAYWSKLIFTGKGAPPDALGSIEDVIAKVSSEPDTIAYIEASKATDAVKVVLTY